MRSGADQGFHPTTASLHTPPLRRLHIVAAASAGSASVSGQCRARHAPRNARPLPLPSVSLAPHRVVCLGHGVRAYVGLYPRAKRHVVALPLHLVVRGGAAAVLVDTREAQDTRLTLGVPTRVRQARRAATVRAAGRPFPVAVAHAAAGSAGAVRRGALPCCPSARPFPASGAR